MKALGIILAGGSSKRMGLLTKNRALAAIPVACTYKSIDFSLSNMTNSGIGKVAVLTMYNAKSINDYLRSSKWWNFGRKNGGLYTFSPMLTSNNSWWYKGTADSIWQNIEWIKSSHEPYVVIASGNGIYKMDYGKPLEYHIKKEADITIVCTKTEDDPRLYGVVSIDKEGRITELQEKPLDASSHMVSCGVYIIRRRLLIELLEECARDDKNDFVNDVVIRHIRRGRVYGYMLDSFWCGITSVESYYKVNMEFLRPEFAKFFFAEEPRIYTRIGDRPPAKYNDGAYVKHSLVSDGCIINSEVRDSLLFKKVYVGNNTKIKDCIIMDNVYIGDNVQLENCIVDSDSTILPGTSYLREDKVRVIAENNNRYDI